MLIDALAFLEGDNERGWRVSRNPIRVLNHLDFIRRKEQISTQLSGTSNLDLLHEFLTIRHLEFHPTDLCNMKCHGCTYSHDHTEISAVHYPFDQIKKLAQFRPLSIVLVGGGEPTLYQSSLFRFPQLVDEISNQIPGVKLALVTNGTYKPLGDWPDRFDWIRISLDAATPKTYTEYKGHPLFSKVIHNFLDYLDSAVPYVGIGFLFSKANIHEYTAVARFIFDLVQENKPQYLHKVNIQYRPLRHDPPHASNGDAISEGDIEQAVREIIDLARTGPEMEKFLREQTNITAVLGGNRHIPCEFSRCYYSEIFKIVRANGDIRPCCIAVEEPELLLGNVLSGSLQEIALNTLRAVSRIAPYCNPVDCRMGKINYVIEQGIMGEIEPSHSADIKADLMF